MSSVGGWKNLNKNVVCIRQGKVFMGMAKYQVPPSLESGRLLRLARENNLPVEDCKENLQTVQLNL